jgi:hypothetical protein
MALKKGFHKLFSEKKHVSKAIEQLKGKKRGGREGAGESWEWGWD